jgi:hypothetical protein
MKTLPITHITLYKHGVGFFERRALVSGEEVELSFRVAEMNDILKSLTVIDWGDGQVLGVDYATPQSLDERLAGCSIRLRDTKSVCDLLKGLRGRRLTLLLDQQETATGTLIGLDEVSAEQPLASSLVSILLDESSQVQTVTLGRVQRVDILDKRGEDDLRFFLHTSLSQEDFRQVTIRLTSGGHDLSVSYIAPAPTWRVSYRMILDSETDPDKPQALLQGWGIFDNQLEEDLQGISLSLVAGMPISFVYDLYTPFTPERPVVKEEARVAAAPVNFEGAALGATLAEEDMEEAFMSRSMAPPAPRAAAKRQTKSFGLADVEQSASVTTSGEAMGELFQYVIDTPVTVGRGQSAMVPIISSKLEYTKDLLYNGAKMPKHPVATLRLENGTGLTLERGPVTVLENGDYVGEAVLPFTVVQSEVVIPYAVELGVTISEHADSRIEMHSIHLKKAYLHIEQWDIRWREYQVNNSTDRAMKVLIEHRRNNHYELFETPEPQEKTAEHLRFEVEAPARHEKSFRVQERRLVSRREELRKQSFKGLQNYLESGLIDQATHDKVAEVLKVWEEIAEKEQALKACDKERQKIYKAQQQIQGNMKALKTSGKEGQLRARYVEQLGATEEQLKDLAQQEKGLNTEIEALNVEVTKRLKA